MIKWKLWTLTNNAIHESFDAAGYPGRKFGRRFGLAFGLQEGHQARNQAPDHTVHLLGRLWEVPERRREDARSLDQQESLTEEMEEVHGSRGLDGGVPGEVDATRGYLDGADPEQPRAPGPKSRAQPGLLRERVLGTSQRNLGWMDVEQWLPQPRCSDRVNVRIR